MNDPLLLNYPYQPDLGSGIWDLNFGDLNVGDLNVVAPSEHSTFRTLFCPVFKGSDRVIRQTIWIPDILDHKTDIFVRFSDCHSKTGPFDNQTCLDHLNTRLVQYSDGYSNDLVIRLVTDTFFWFSKISGMSMPGIRFPTVFLFCSQWNNPPPPLSIHPPIIMHFPFLPKGSFIYYITLLEGRGSSLALRYDKCGK